MTSDRDLLAQWAGEALAAVDHGPAAGRAQHAARGRFYLDMLRGALPAGPIPAGAPLPGRR